MGTAIAIKAKPRVEACRKNGDDCLCFRDVDTGQHWLIKFDSLGRVMSSCHLDWASDLSHLIFSTEYNEFLEAESEKLEFVTADFRHLW